MPAYFSLGTKNSDSISEKYIQINNCGFCEDMEKTAVSRPQGRKDYQLIYVKSGTLAFGREDPQLFGPGHVYLYKPGVPQHYRVRGEVSTFYWIHFTGSALPEMLEALESGAVFTGDFPEFERFCKDFYLEHRLSEQPNALYYEGSLICLLAQLLKSHSPLRQPRPHRKLEAALLAMNRDIRTRRSNQELAQLCGLSRYYFIRLFKNATGQTPQQYYTVLALETAKGLLENTDHTVAQIASLCGIEDGFYFSRLFKKHVGLSPADYRKNPSGKGGQKPKNVL